MSIGVFKNPLDDVRGVLPVADDEVSKGQQALPLGVEERLPLDLTVDHGESRGYNGHSANLVMWRYTLGEGVRFKRERGLTMGRMDVERRLRPALFSMRREPREPSLPPRLRELLATVDPRVGRRS